ncbi:Fe3+/spermidine/putrescine ABC transporter ATP-binding protein [Achromobacter marplatensis]|uniref:Spermidine/putrescine import ATP-binding protein PotA n=1 Tax=Achromobacter marplatensis TaxID=470868 RepID=A0ABX9G1V9_9BURK|nr:ABC transporter ATP-binding protein [Achromobacter marplatensis]OWT56310.1 Fe3+/spermidine/putrescine ABC transporter ATP-binding protein [Achromobacter marplatensis]RBP12112.1 spermidine/putrescine transport system ATP-binding protein [Achromobacter marplatensis]CAB3707744.1 Spermidine/putrescine import ATP-binding protein PotA [Achromobacter marplatensis]
MSALLTIEGVSMRFGAYQALDHIDLDIQQGEFVALLGPSGCGKTTLLRSIAGFLKPESGRILIDGQDISRLAAHHRPLNTVFQNYALFPHMTVLENVAYGPRRQGASKAEAAERARAALDMVGLADFGPRYPREMSGGQQQRVALARAIVNQPKLLLLDEPLSALDLKLRKRMQLELKHLQAKLGIAFIFVTHDQEEAMTMADRVVVMHAGRIEQVGAGTDIYRQPATRFVAEFIGDANFMAFTATEGGTLQLEAQGLRVPLGGKPAPARGVAVLRPEDLRLSAEASAHTLTGAVTDVINVGSHSMIHVDIGGQSVVARHGGIAPAELRPGTTVHLAFAPEHLHLIGEQP